MNLNIFKGYEHFPGGYPADAVSYAMQHKDEAIPELLEILEHTIHHAEELSKDPDYLLHIPAIYLLAYFREPKAYDAIIRLASLPDDQVYHLYGEITANHFKNIVASVCDGNLAPIKAIIEDTALDEFVRAEALQALLILLNNNMVTREQLVSYFKDLLNGRLIPDHTFVWSTLPQCCSMIHPYEFIDDIEKAVTDGKLLEVIADLEYMRRQARRPFQEVLEELKTSDEYSFVTQEDMAMLEKLVQSHI